MLSLLILLSLFPSSDLRDVRGRATIYWPGDGFCGKWLADGGIFKDEDDHIAHRTIPLGTKGVLCNRRTKRCVATVVRDRGPYGAIRNCQFDEPTPPRARRIKRTKKCLWWQLQIKLKDGWRRRISFDLTRPIAEAIGHRSFDKVIFYYGGSMKRVKL